MAKKTHPQGYPRIQNEADKYYGYLEANSLVDHKKKISLKELKKIIQEAIEYANSKSSREILSINSDATEQEKHTLYRKKGAELFLYFVRYCGDPASTAYDCLNKHYSVIAKENFRLRTIQKERMNAGWRYQNIAKDAARSSGRFESISGLNLIEADFSAGIFYKKLPGKLNIYVSIKNRSNTMGGQDWPKAISSLENAALNDKNRSGNYICVFGIAIERGMRNIKTSQKTQMPHSVNTEIWHSDFFWPFFSNYSYDEIAKAVLDILMKNNQSSGIDTIIPQQLIDSFGDQCRKFKLLDEQGRFNDAHKLVDLFCGKL